MAELPEVTINPIDFRNTLGRFATGVTVITTEVDGQVHGMTANAFMSVSLDPPLVLISVGNKARLNQLLAQTGRYGVSILNESHELFSTHFAGRPQEGLEISFVKRAGVPVLENALANLVTRVVNIYPAGDHTLYIGQVEHLEWQDQRPLLFYSGKYRQLNPEPNQPMERWLDDELFFFSSVEF